MKEVKPIELLIFCILVFLAFLILANLDRYAQTKAYASEVVVEEVRTSVSMEVTAYCPCIKCCGKTDGVTASGTIATEGRTIAASKDIPFGTIITINNHDYIVEDRGGAIGEGHIDVFCESHKAALQFGRQTLEVFIKE